MPVKDLRKWSTKTLYTQQETHPGVNPPFNDFQQSTASKTVPEGVIRSWENTPNYWATVGLNSHRVKIKWRRGRPYVTLEKKRVPLMARQLAYMRNSQSGSFYVETVPDYSSNVWNKHVWFGDIEALRGEWHPEVPEILPDWELILKARSRLQDERTWRAPVFLAEAGKSVEMITDAAQRLARAAREAKKLNWWAVYDALGVSPKEADRFKGRLKSNADAFSSNWLALQYGWKPLLMDMDSAAQSLAALQSVRPSQQFPTEVRVRLQRAKTFDSGVTLQVSPDIECYGRLSVSVSKVLVMKAWVSNPQIYNAASLGLTNPAAIAWELVPFSFVADWFLPIGDVLNSIDALHGMTVGDCYIGVKRTSTFEAKSLSSRWFNGKSSVNGTSSRLEVLRRTDVSPSAYIPSSIPLSFDIGTTRATSAITLLHQLLKK